MIDDSMRNFKGETEHPNLRTGWGLKMERGFLFKVIMENMRVRIDFLLIEVCVFQIRCVYQGMILLWVLGCQL